MKRLKNSLGMSFLEMMVSVAIFTVIMSSIFTVIYTGRLYWRVGSSQIDAQQQARQAVAYMAKELRQARAGTGRVGGGSPVAILENLPADDNAYTFVTFRIPQDTNGDGDILDSNGWVVEWSDKITYSLAGTQLIRSTDTGATKVLANNISTLQFTRSSTSPLLIKIRVVSDKVIPGTGETISVPLSTWIRLEN